MTTEATPREVGSHDGLGLVWRLRAPSMTDTTATHIDRMRMAADEIERAWAARDAAVADLEAHAEAEVRRAVAAERDRYAPLLQAVEWLLDDGHMDTGHLARLRAAFERA